jgi:hypothetical protein
MRPASAAEHSWLYSPSLSPSRWLVPALRLGQRSAARSTPILGASRSLGSSQLVPEGEKQVTTFAIPIRQVVVSRVGV